MSNSRDTKLEDALQLYKLLANTIQNTTISAWLDIDLPTAQMRVLFFLANSQNTTVGKLSEALFIGLPAASRLVERLVKEDLVIRAEDPEDRRRTLVRLSPRGEVIAKSIGSVMHDKMQSLLSELNEDDLDALLRGLRAIEEIITYYPVLT